MISQVGALLKSAGRSNPLASLGVQKEYLTGYSQTGGYMITYINEFAPRSTLAGGAPIFDGYLIGAGYGFTELAPLNQCAVPTGPGMPGFVVQPPGSAPVIDVQTLSDSYGFFGYAGERPDGDAPGDRYRLYQVAGSSHIWTGQVDYTPGPDDLARAGFPPNDWEDHCLYPNNPFPLGDAMDVAFAGLDGWVRRGTPPPRASRIEAIGAGTPAATIVTDEYGNAVGGVRSPYVDVPIASYHGTTPGQGTCMLLWGHWIPFDGAQLARLYPTHRDYVQKVKRSAAALWAGRWLTAEDAARIVDEARVAPVP